MDDWKRSEQIPAFGDWDFANDLPITRYFECARPAGLVRYSSSSSETPNRQHNKPLPPRNHKKQENINKERRCRHVNGNNLREQQQRKGMRRSKEQDDTVRKAVDEDLYKIPPELLHPTNKRNKMLRFISNCLLLPAACVCHES
ncbi:hypothetical protein RJT34_23290 [Clitoria ternatea]|uniref:RIN4 pathogenic type III effector avirulence factor Avr cleavage site domain-containing protein n=1 Tax=Clitoria ternatea TaxID=43366 RepID=A0AAN9FKU6_CLITE